MKKNLFNDVESKMKREMFKQKYCCCCVDEDDDSYGF